MYLLKLGVRYKEKEKIHTYPPPNLYNMKDKPRALLPRNLINSLIGKVEVHARDWGLG